jgi:hypothetical protein
MPQGRKILEVTWLDAFGRGGWMNNDAISDWVDQECECKSVGYLHGENKHYLLILQSWHPDQVGAPLAIPKKWILKKRVLR